MTLEPFVCDVNPTGLAKDGGTMQRRALSDMRGVFLDEAARAAMDPDTEVYEFHSAGVPALSTELAFGVSICMPGKVGAEFFMTKGHYHAVLDCAEVYICQSGRGIMLMETPDGRWAAPELLPGQAVYVPGGWAHRTVNIANEPFITLFSLRADSGHDYQTIESKGFRKLIVAEGDGYAVIDNPKWQ